MPHAIHWLLSACFGEQTICCLTARNSWRECQFTCAAALTGILPAMAHCSLLPPSSWIHVCSVSRGCKYSYFLMDKTKR